MSKITEVLDAGKSSDQRLEPLPWHQTMHSGKVPTSKAEARSLRTKIVCTLGPASSDEATLRAMIEAGMTTARINMSHGHYADHAKRIAVVRHLAQEMNRVVAVMIDLQGPKLRIGEIEHEPIRLEKGQRVTFISSAGVSRGTEIPLPHAHLIDCATIGNTVWLDDGLLELAIVEKTAGTLHCEVVVGGLLYSHKGISVPGVLSDIPAITSKDRHDIAFAVEQKADFIAMSFVQSSADLEELRGLMATQSASIPIVAKIETLEGLNNLEQIVEAADAVMVARGDLGVEAIFEEVPAYQMRIIRACNRAALPVITATQMLHSMIHSSHPTRAEANDVFTAVLQGSDAVMLSSETAAGDHPVRAVEVMSKIARMAEQHFPYTTWNTELAKWDLRSITEGIGQATCTLAASVGAKAVVTNTISGRTTREVAKHRPQSLIISTTPRAETHQQMALVWGVESLLVPEFHDTDSMISGVKRAVIESNLIQSGDAVVITAGAPVGQIGQTNLIEVHTLRNGDLW